MSDSKCSRPAGTSEPRQEAPGELGKGSPGPALSRRAFVLGGAAFATLWAAGCDDETGASDAPDELDASDTVQGRDTAWIDELRVDTSADVQDAPDTDVAETADTVDEGADSTDASVGPRFDPAGWNLSPAKFPLGVQAGAMRQETAIVWAYVADVSPKLVRVWEDEGEGAAGLLVFAADAEANDGGFCKVPVSGLQAGQHYHYAFFDDAAKKRSDVGRFRAAFAPGILAPLTLGATSCTAWDHAPFPALSYMAGEPLDLMVHLGDMVYSDSAPEATTLEAYRAKWRALLGTPGYRDLLASTGLLNVWDDHELANNLDPETVDPARLEAAKTAFFEALAAAEGPEHRLWTSYRWGDTAELFLLDCRSERAPSTREGADPIYLSKAQMQWLKDALLASPCHFKILLNSVPITNMPLIYDLLASDRWEGYAAQRTELLEFLESNGLTNVWFLAGDFHLGFVGRVGTEGYARGLYEIAVGPGGHMLNPVALLPHPGDQFPFVGQSGDAATVLTFDPVTNTVRVRFVDAVNGNAVMVDRTFAWGV